MGNKKKFKRKQSLDVQHEPSKSHDEPPVKRKKDQNWYPGKFVLLKTPGAASDGDASANGSFEKPEKTLKHEGNGKQLNGKRPKSNLDHKSKNIKNGSDDFESQLNPKIAKRGKEFKSESKASKGRVNIKDPDNSNGMRSKPTLEPLCVDKKLNKKKQSSGLEALERDDLSSDSEDWDDMEEGSTSYDEEVSEEWSTDTDYSEGDSIEDEYSFHGSDCESVSDDENDRHDWDDGGSHDSDYVPEIEDKYIKRGDAIFHDAQGLHLAFGDSDESRIIEITDIAPAIMASSDDEAPQLIPPEGEEMSEEQVDTLEPEDLIRNLDIDDTFRSNLLLNSAAFFDCVNDQGVVLKISNAIHFHGVLIVRALANSIQINGYTLQANETITASSISRADYFLNLTPIIEPNVNENLSDELGKLLKLEDVTKLMSSYDKTKEAIVHLQHGPPDSTIDMLKNYSLNPLLPNKKMLMNSSSELILSAKFFVSSENQKVSTFQENEQWNFLKLNSTSKLLVTGGKNVGKSGLCQFLINKNIAEFKKILLIDLDIGQPICSPAQTVSATLLTRPIIGPGYLSKNQPDKCLLYGDKSVMISPFKYVRCVRQLVKFCSENPEYQNVPWIVNTMGYQKGFGLQLICLLVKILEPTDVVQIQHGMKSYNFAKIVTEDVVNGLELNFFDAEDVDGISAQTFFTTHVVDSIVNNNEIDAASKWISNAAEKRKLSMLAQLSRLLKGNQSCFNDVTPFVAPINKVRMVVIDEEYSQQEQGFNLDLLNANLVYLCQANEDEALSSMSILDCYGLGIVRGIDKINEKIFILLPQTDGGPKLQANFDVLAIGNIPLPAEILLKQSFNVAGCIPHVTFFKDRNASSKKYVNKRNIKDCY